mgnify:CR=1 FL=1
MRKDEKRLSLKLDGETYRRLRQRGLDDGLSNQAMCEAAVKAWLGNFDRIDRLKAALEANEVKA